jgi:hypothetical protein
VLGTTDADDNGNEENLEHHAVVLRWNGLATSASIKPMKGARAAAVRNAEPNGVQRKSHCPEKERWH